MIPSRNWVAVFVCCLFLAVSVTIAQESAETNHHPDFLEIITPHEGVDFTAFSADLLQTVKRNWKLPAEAKQGTKGKVVVRFGIQKDGQLSNVPKVEVSSANKALDEAAVFAVKTSAPFEHLPNAFKRPSIDLRLTFLYNQPFSARNP
jgi:TonB family protein